MSHNYYLFIIYKVIIIIIHLTELLNIKLLMFLYLRLIHLSLRKLKAIIDEKHSKTSFECIQLNTLYMDRYDIKSLIHFNVKHLNIIKLINLKFSAYFFCNITLFVY